MTQLEEIIAPLRSLRVVPEYARYTGVSWEEYEQLGEDLMRRGSHARVTFDDGELEIVGTGNKHEGMKTIIARMLETYALEADISITGFGSMTLQRKRLKKGLDPDECYYVQTPKPAGANDPGIFNLNKNPPPDLAIEVEISRGSIPKQPIYSALGVKELWRWTGERIAIFQLVGKEYQAREKSLAFPKLEMSQFNRFVTMAVDESHHVAARALRDWVRSLNESSDA